MGSLPAGHAVARHDPRGGTAVSRVTVVPGGQSPRRLDVFVRAQSAHVSRAAVQRWIASGIITVNGRRAKPAQRIRPGDVIASHAAVRAPRRVEGEALPLRVLHEDAALLVVDKAPGLVMHPAPGNWTGTLLNGLVHHLHRAGAEPWPASGDALQELADHRPEAVFSERQGFHRRVGQQFEVRMEHERHPCEIDARDLHVAAGREHEARNGPGAATQVEYPGAMRQLRGERRPVMGQDLPDVVRRRHAA